MTRKIVSWLAGMAVFLIFHSCRNDVFPEKEAFQNTGSFQLTSRRISLAESKHKLKLTPELSKAETFLKSLKTDVSGKTFSCGNGVSIDTDEVIYIENGQNYHTYTFHIKRENALPDDPVDNLVLVPLTDGTYRELMISYTLTEMEKQQILNGDNVDTKGKSSVVDLGISSLHPSASKSQDCQWVEADSYTWCSESMHNSGEGPDICHAQTRSKLVKVVLLKCTSVDDGTGNTGWSSGNGGSSGNNGGGSDSSQGGTEATQPCNGNGIATSPLDPSTDLGGNNCSGIPTIPNLPHPNNNPCAKTKALLNNPEVKTKLDSLKNKSLNKGEIGFKTQKDGTVTGYISGGKHEVDLGVKAGYQGGYHNHTPAGIPMHSPPDIDNNLLAFARAQPAGEHKNAYFGMIVKKVCTGCPSGYKIYHYIIRFDGTYDDSLTSFSQLDIDNFNKDYRKLHADFTDLYGPYGSTYIDTITGELTNEGLEILFFDTINKMGLNNKVILQRIEDNGIVNNINLDTDGLHTNSTPCT